MNNKTIDTWHEIIKSRNQAGLKDILADDVSFHSPVVHTPQQGKGITRVYLEAALDVFANNTFSYVRQLVGEQDAVLEFTVEIKGVFINGVDMISWGDDGKITDFKVMIRPLKAIQMVHQEMAARLQPKAAANEKEHT